MVDCFVSRDDHGNRRRTIVEEVLGPSLLSLRMSSAPAVLEPKVVKVATKQVLLGLDYLHKECGALHLGALLCSVGGRSLISRRSWIRQRSHRSSDSRGGAGDKHWCASILWSQTNLIQTLSKLASLPFQIPRPFR